MSGGVLSCHGLGVGVGDTNMLVFFALGNAKVLSFALADAKVPNASSFASQWNIGFSLKLECH